MNPDPLLGNRDRIMNRLLAIIVLSMLGGFVHANGVATCGDNDKAGQGLLTCMASFSYQSAPAQNALVLTCQSSQVPVGLQDMSKCPSSVWKTRSSVTSSELVGFCAQSQLVPYTVCDYPAGKEGYGLASNVLGIGPPPLSPGTPVLTGPAAISWAPVVLNTDGAPATVTGYRIEYGQTDFAQTVTTSAAYYTFTLAVGTWNFRVVALSAYGESAPSAAMSTTIEAGASASPAPNVTLSANPTAITAGNSATLAWTSVNATSCSGVGSGTSGSVSVSPQSTTAYSQTCTGAGGTASSSAVVTVMQPSGGTWSVAPNGTRTTRTLYEAVLPPVGTALVRGNPDGKIAVGRPCGAEVFKEGTTSYRSVANSDAQLSSPTYATRAHVAACVNQ